MMDLLIDIEATEINKNFKTLITSNDNPNAS